MTRIEVAVHQDYFPGAHWDTKKEWDDDEFEDNHGKHMPCRDKFTIQQEPTQKCMDGTWIG